jgi:hypothetical protein
VSDHGGLLDQAIDKMMDRFNVPIAPGVEGVERDLGDIFELASVRAVRAVQEGSGAVGAYLDRLPRDRTVIVPFVVSDCLAEMLERRGFSTPDVFDHPLLGTVSGGQIMVRQPALRWGRTQG